MANEEILRAVIRVYPTQDLPFDFEAATRDQILKASKGRKFSDTLLSFIIMELADCTSKDEAVHRMDVAVAELSKVLRALEDL